MWKRFKLAWKVMFKAEPSRENLMTFLGLFHETPDARATNMGGSYEIEFKIKLGKPKNKKRGTWGWV